MINSERRDAIKRLGAECKALEAQAGIEAAIARAQEGRFMPDPNDSTDEYFANHHDAVRKKTRDAYFGVTDIDLRKRLIAAHLALDRAISADFEADYVDAAKRLGIAELAAKQAYWGRALLAALACAAIGGYRYGGEGFLGGAVIGVFLGLWLRQTARGEAGNEMEAAKAELGQQLENKNEAARSPDFFSRDEEASGLRNASTDQESALFNLLQRK